jgi:hypothetical protein
VTLSISRETRDCEPGMEWNSDSYEFSESSHDDSTSDIEPNEIENYDSENEPSEDSLDNLENENVDEPSPTTCKTNYGGIEIPWTTEDVVSDRQKKFRPADGCFKNCDRFRNLGFLGKNSLYFFLLMFPLTFWTQIVKNSNSYAEFLGVRDFVKIEVWEIILFLAILLINILKKTQRVEFLWSRNKIYYSKYFHTINMTYARFKFIRRYLHISPINDVNINDKYHKIRLMKETLIENSKLNNPCSEKYAVDEMTIGFQGRTTLIKRTKGKKVSKGFQCIALTSSAGYLLDFEFDQEVEGVNSYPKLNPTQNRVMRVTTFLIIDKYATVYLDNRFCSAMLFFYLFQKRFCYATGTWRTNFGVPKLILLNKSNRVREIQNMKALGIRKCMTYIRVPNQSGITIIGISFYDNAPVHLITTAAYEFQQLLGGTKNKLRLDVTHDYNKYMHGNDIADGLLVTYSSYIKSRKYWMRLFHFLLDCGINNAYLLQRILLSFENKTLEHGKFYLSLAEELVNYGNDLCEEYIDRRQSTNPSQSIGVNRHNINQYYHERIHSDETHFAIVSNSRGRCKYCAVNNTRSNSNMFCEICGVHLCLNGTRNCFKLFHTEKRL